MKPEPSETKTEQSIKMDFNFTSQLLLKWKVIEKDLNVRNCHN